MTLNNHDGDVYVETTGEYSEIVLKTPKVRVDGDVYCFDGDVGISARIDAALPPKCVPPGGKYLQFNGTNWLCVCEPNWTGDTCEVSPSPPPPTWTEDTSVAATPGSNSWQSWQSITSSSDGTKLAAVAYGGADYGYIWTSTDSGATWTGGGNTQPWRSITSSSDGTKLAAVADGGNIWTSTDSGTTWTENAHPTSGKNWYSITSSSDGTKLAAVVRNGNIWTSTDSGATWSENTSTGSGKSWNSITSSSDGTKLAVVVYNGNIWTTR